MKLNDTLLSGPPYFDHTFYENRKLCYCLTAVYDHCESDSSEIACVSIPFSINEIESDKVIVFPNPGKDFISVKSDINMGKITLINSYGEIQEQSIAENQNHCTLDTSPYKDGIYFLRIETDKGIVVKKISIIR